MKKTTMRIWTVIMLLCMTISFALPAYATGGDGVFIPEEFIAEELNAWAEQHEVGVRFDNINVELLDGEMSDDEIEASVRAYVDMMKDAISNMSSELVCQPIMSRAVGNYQARVESMIPALGWGYINHDFKADVSSSKIHSVTLLGNSYDTGFTIGTWEPNYSWTDISNNKEYLQISSTM